MGIFNFNKKQQPTNVSSQTQKTTFKPFVFESNQHQRYENNNPVQGIQKCPRTIIVEKNINGCSGYKLVPGEGYIVRGINGDTGNPQFTPKPMLLIKSSESVVELRGYEVEAMTPFGYEKFDQSDYGLTVYYKDGEVERCILHMFDRKIDLEYMKVEPEITEAEQYVNAAMNKLRGGQDGDAVYHPLYLAWRSIQNNPEQLADIVDDYTFGSALSIFLSFGTVNVDIDAWQQITSLSYLFLSKAINANKNKMNAYKNRIMLMLSNNEAFQYTVSSVVNKDMSIMSFAMGFHQFDARDAMYKMEYADFAACPQVISMNDYFARAYRDLENKVNSNFFRKDADTLIMEGIQLHKDITDYLENKVITEQDIDF